MPSDTEYYKLRIMKKVIIFSLNFNSAHVSHLLASYLQCAELGYDPILCINENFEQFIINKNINYIVFKKNVIPKEVSLSIFLFPSLHNITQSLYLKLFTKSKIIYLYHEPLEHIKSYLLYHSILETCIIILKNIISLFTVILSDAILLPSKKSFNLYEHNHYTYLNKHYFYFPLLYPDYIHTNTNYTRTYFSYIGGICKDHAFDEYLSFILKAIEEKFLLNDGIKFCIATRNKLNINDTRIAKALESGRLVIQQGRHLTNEEISDYYSKSYVIWNAYNRTNQSGVLANSFMFGTPALVMKSNLSEFIKNHIEVLALNSNKDYQEITIALKEIITNFEQYSKAARKCFLENFYYKSQNERFRNIIDKI